MRRFLRALLNTMGLDVVPLIKRTDVLRSGEVVNVNHSGHDYLMFVANARDHIQSFHYAGQLYEVDDLALMAAHFRPGSIFVDVGANVGNHTVFAAKELEASRIIAFEPVALQYTILSINVALNDFIDRVSIHRLGLSDKAGSATVDNSNIHNIGRAHIVDEGDGEVVTLTTGDAALEGVEVSFIKIDVEGHEMATLYGLSNTISDHRPIIFIEVDNQNATAFRNWLNEVNYQIVESRKHYAQNENFLIKPGSD